MSAHRFFGLFDVLGFSEHCKTRSAQQLMEDYRGLFSDVQSATTYVTENSEHVLIFSDTVCLAEPGLETRQEAVKHLFRQASLLIHNSILGGARAHRLPFRGCVSFGEYVFSKDARVFASSDAGSPVVLGKAVVSAAEWERKQKWVGASIVPTDVPEIRRALPDMLGQLTDEGYLIESDVPTVDGPVRTFAINFVTAGHANRLRELAKQNELDRTHRGDIKSANKWREARIFVERAIVIERFVPQK